MSLLSRLFPNTFPVTISESADAATDAAAHPIETVTPLAESAVRRDGTIAIKVAEEGWGSTGYYGRELLESATPAAFPAGTHMYWNHDTGSEELERPEGDLSRLAAVTIDAPRWDDNGVEGAGMYANAKVFEGYAATIDEIAPYIGVSMRANGQAIMGQADGRNGRIITGIEPHALNRIDFVTKPGAGGRIVSIFESAGRGDSAESVDDANGAALSTTENNISTDSAEITESSTAATPPSTSIGGDGMENETVGISEAAQAQLDAQSAELARLRESLMLRDASDIARGAIDAADDLPAVTRARLVRESLRNVPTDDEGAIDAATLRESVATLITEARSEFAALTGSGQVFGHGGAPVKESAEIDPQQVEADMKEALSRLGFGGS